MFSLRLRPVLFVLLAWAMTAASAHAAGTPRFVPTARWRGFNLTDRMSKDWAAEPYREQDFRLIARWGFNFVRLPLDYRLWIRDGDPRAIDESAFAEIDRAIEWGRAYGLHVCLNLHRAPGYAVADPPEAADLWTDPEALDLCAMHWAALARRYRDVPPQALSFNLVNEPPDLDGAAYATVMGRLIREVRRHGPRRPIVCDGLAFGRLPCPELAPLNVIQATRGYLPPALTHYAAPWVDGSEAWPAPTWPMTEGPGYLYGPMKPEWSTPALVRARLDSPMDLSIAVGAVAGPVRLVVRVDGREVIARRFECGPSAGRKAEWIETYGQYRCTYDETVAASVPAGERAVEIACDEGDWLSLRGLSFAPAGKPGEALGIAAGAEWGAPPGEWSFDPARRAECWRGPGTFDRERLRADAVAPWTKIAARGTVVMVGEFGVYNRTAHDVALRWMEDNLRNWRDAGWGWALWNFRGPFGILDSGRDDVDYEDVEGHLLDRRMLELLQRH